MKRPRPRIAGFTLVELLVAHLDLRVLGVLAYGGYNNSVKQTEIARAA